MENTEDVTKLLMFLQIKILQIEKQLSDFNKIFKKNYITIKGFENLHNLKITEWKLSLQKLFFKNDIPLMWILNSIMYCSKNNKVIVYVYLISNPVLVFVKNKLINYVKEKFTNVSIE
jgi:hypothetical protein